MEFCLHATYGSDKVNFDGLLFKTQHTARQLHNEALQ